MNKKQMSTKTINPAKVHGTIQAPASKSMTQRAYACALLAKGKSTIRKVSSCDDALAAIKIIQQLGAEVSQENDTISIEGGFAPRENQLNCGEAGLGIRMFTPIASLSKNEITLVGEGSLKKRPHDILQKPLEKLGVQFQSDNGYLPLKVKGPFTKSQTNLDGSLSSQVLTGVLIALGSTGKEARVLVKKLKSKPYAEMTLDVMKAFGVEAYHSDYQEFLIPGFQDYQATDYTVEGDWSGAAFLLVAGAIAGEVKVENLQERSNQADKKILAALRRSKAKVVVEKNAAIVSKNQLEAFEFDATECPDLFPPLVSLAAHCNGITKLKGVSRLAHKESDRGIVLQEEFSKLGVNIKLDGDLMLIHGGKVKGGKMHAQNDHRIAMAGAVAALAAESPVEIENPECIAKSYPEFYEDLEKVVSSK